MIEKNFFKKILKEVKNRLNYTLEENKRIIICFAGVPSSGKTYLAKKLEKKCKGVRINNDDIRKIIGEFIREKEKIEEILREFLINLLKNYPFKNHFVILDSGIERKFEEVKNAASSTGWRMFIIKMVVPKKIIIKRLKIKDKERLEKHPEDLKRWFKDYKEFNKKIKPDFIFRGNTDLKKLLSKLKKL